MATIGRVVSPYRGTEAEPDSEVTGIGSRGTAGLTE
jgi:hypothetical protein